MIDTESHNIAVCSEIRNIAGANGRYTSGLSRRIEKTGKDIEDLTVGELLELDREYNEFFNRTYTPSGNAKNQREKAESE